MTRLTPNEMMGFKDETGFPSLRIERSRSTIDSLAKINDNQAKAIMVRYANIDKHTKPMNFKLNDTVMVKLDRKNKFEPIYDPSLSSPYIITAINGSMITATRSQPAHQITRNCSFFRHLQFQSRPLAPATPADKHIFLPVIPPYIQDVPTPPQTPAVMDDNVFQPLPPVQIQIPVRVVVPTGRRGRPTGVTVRVVEPSDRKLRSSSNQHTATGNIQETRSRSNSPAKKEDALNGPYWKR